MHARVGREIRKAAAQDGEEPFLDGELVEEDEVENNPPDRKQPVARAEESRSGCGLHGHVIRADGHCQRDAESEQRGEVNADMQPGDGAQQHHDGQCGDERRKQGAAKWIVVLRPSHGEWGKETRNRRRGQALDFVGRARIPIVHGGRSAVR
ncbi:MAG: hypothetical protein IPK15_18930 [Verrucomicrobia bacterium]|nr:hypothetical protein [Verrucomicrobiota bacterium]